ncbi:hypothetical protein U1Q18_038317 [Sarracenia purpurea var. burkii]
MSELKMQLQTLPYEVPTSSKMPRRYGCPSLPPCIISSSIVMLADEEKKGSEVLTGLSPFMLVLFQVLVFISFGSSCFSVYGVAVSSSMSLGSFLQLAPPSKVSVFILLEFRFYGQEQLSEIPCFCFHRFFRLFVVVNVAGAVFW